MYHLPTYLNEFIGQTFPNLKHLTFREGLSGTLDGVPFISDESKIQTLDLLLSTQNFAINPLMAAFRRVRRLKLGFRWDRALYRAFLREAHTFAHLEELYLDGLDYDDIWLNDQTPIALPNLTTLLISGNMPSIVKRFETPKLMYYYVISISFATFIPDWYPIFHNFDYPAIRFLRVEVNGEFGSFVDLGISGCSQQDFPETWIPPLYARFDPLFPKPCPDGLKWFSLRRHSVGLDTASELLSLLLPRTISLRNLKMDLCGNPAAYTISSILRPLGAISTLQHLEISADQECFIDILNVLCEGSHCPGLETLVFIFTYSDERRHPTSEELISFVETRGKTGIPLQLLALENCDPLEEKQYLMCLETLGTQVTFNAGVGFE